MAKRPKFHVSTPSPSAIEDVWLRRATAVAIEQARSVVSSGGVRPNTPIGRLSDTEWGWIVAAVLFGWISTKAEQAVSNGVGIADSIRSTELVPDPWDVGAIAAILPELADCDIDWSKPLAALSRDELLMFLGDAMMLTQQAMAARDRGQSLVTQRSPANTAREVNAAAGGPLMTPDELNEPVGVT